MCFSVTLFKVLLMKEADNVASRGRKEGETGRQGKCVCLRQGGQFEQCSRDRGCFALLSQCYVSIRIRGWDLPG